MNPNVLEAMAETAHRNERCPWNPFPRDSEWGRKIDDWYRTDTMRQRAAYREQMMKGE